MKCGYFCFLFLLLTFSPFLTFGHSGRLDSYGCHNDTIHGGYHCHRDYNLSPIKTIEYWGHVKALAYYSDIKKTYPNQRMELLEFGEQVAKLAQEEFDKKDLESWQESLQWLLQIADAIVSLSPGVSWAKDTYEFISGKELISQTVLNEQARYLAAIGMLSGGIGNRGIQTLKILKKARDQVSKFGKNYIGLPIIGKFTESFRKFGLLSKESLVTAKEIKATEVEAIYSKIEIASKAVTDWIGDGGALIRNKAGDIVILSKDGKRRVRFDLKNPYPHKNPHAHVEEFKNGDWEKSGPIYPDDVIPH